MKKFLCIIVTVFVFFSCENDDLTTKINESNDLYVFRGVEYILEEGDGTIYHPLQEDVSLSATIGYDTAVFCFCPDGYLPYLLRSNESLNICVPEDIVDGEIVLSPDIWKYSEEKTGYVRTPVNIGNLKLKEHTQQPDELQTLKEELTVTYIASFVGMVTGNEVRLKGKWRRECITQKQ